MAPHRVKISKACKAMEPYGFPEEKVKTELKRLLKLYNNRWELIEEDDYRVLLEFFFEGSGEENKRVQSNENKGALVIREAKNSKSMKGDASSEDEPEEPEVPLKRRLRNQKNQASSTVDNFNLQLAIISPMRATQSEAALEAKEQAQPPPNKRAKTLYSGPPREKGKEKKFPETASIRKEFDIEKGCDIVIQDNMLDLYQNEYCKSFPEDVAKYETALVVDHPALPGLLHEDDSSVGNCSNTKADDLKFLEFNKPLDVEDKVAGSSNSSQVDIASSANGDVKLSLICNASGRLDIGSPNLGANFKLLEGRCRKLDTQPGHSNGSVIFYQKIAEAVPQVPKLVHLDGVGNSNQVNGFNALKDLQTSNTSSMEGVQKNDIVKYPNYVEDISRGEESVPISLVNDNGAMKLPKFRYISKNMVYKNAYVNFSLARISDDNCCAQCSGDCLSSTIPCACAFETRGEFAYTPDGLVKESFLSECIAMSQRPRKHHYYYCETCPLEKNKRKSRCKGHLMRKFIKECWSKCGCNRKCGNRVVQRGLQQILQVFRAPEGKGWGLRSVHGLKKGTFICEYVGEIVTNQELHERNEERTGNEEHTYPVLLDADWGSERILKDEEALCLDATKFGNVARFINHRCYDANLVEIPVEVETPDHHFYHLAFFTTREIKEMEELTWDYGIEFDDENHPIKAFTCKCGSIYCREKDRSIV